MILSAIPWFDTAFRLFQYSVSYIELISVVAGIAAVYLAAREKIWTWPVGLINICTAFFIYYHVSLYSDMFLQIYFFGISLYGWIVWRKEQKSDVPLKWLPNGTRIMIGLSIIFSTMVLGNYMTQIHMVLPEIFTEKAAYPYADTWVATTSIVANTLMAKRFIESWILWVAIDVLCVYLYYQKDIHFIALEFLFFLGLATYGLYSWMHLKKQQDQSL